MCSLVALKQEKSYHGLEGDVTVLLEGGLALLLGGRPVVGDVGHVALLLVGVLALDGAVVDGLLDLWRNNEIVQFFRFR